MSEQHDCQLDEAPRKLFLGHRYECALNQGGISTPGYSIVCDCQTSTQPTQPEKRKAEESPVVIDSVTPPPNKKVAQLKRSIATTELLKVRPTKYDWVHNITTQGLLKNTHYMNEVSMQLISRGLHPTFPRNTFVSPNLKARSDRILAEFLDDMRLEWVFIFDPKFGFDNFITIHDELRFESILKQAIRIINSNVYLYYLVMNRYEHAIGSKLYSVRSLSPRCTFQFENVPPFALSNNVLLRIIDKLETSFKVVDQAYGASSAIKEIKPLYHYYNLLRRYCQDLHTSLWDYAKDTYKEPSFTLCGYWHRSINVHVSVTRQPVLTPDEDKIKNLFELCPGHSYYFT